MSTNVAISDKIIELVKRVILCKKHLFKTSFIVCKRLINSYFSKESHLECILKAKDELFKVKKWNKIYACQIHKIYAAAPKLLKAIAENQGHHVE